MYHIEISYKSLLHIFNFFGVYRRFKIILDELLKLSLVNSLLALECCYNIKPLRHKIQHTLQLIRTEWALHIYTIRQKCTIKKNNSRYNNKLYKCTGILEKTKLIKLLIKHWKVSFSNLYKDNNYTYTTKINNLLINY